MTGQIPLFDLPPLPPKKRKQWRRVAAPTCPREDCGTPAGVPVEDTEGRYYGDGNIKCPACGWAWTGTPEQRRDSILSLMQWIRKESKGGGKELRAATSRELQRWRDLLKSEGFEP